MKRIARLKKDTMLTMGNWPEEKCSEVPPRLQGMVSVKRRKRRVINISRKFHADLANGIIKFFVKKKTGVASVPEFQIDLAKATVMYDDKRIVLILKVANEIHSLIPIDDTLDHWREAIFKHRLYRQEAVKKGWQQDTAHTLEAISVPGQSEELKWESHSCNKMFDEVHQMQGLTLEVLEKLTKTYEEMQKTNEDLKNSLKNIKDAISRPTETTSMWTTASNSITPSNATTVPRSTTPASSMGEATSSLDSKQIDGSESDEDDEDERKKKKTRQDRSSKKK